MSKINIGSDLPSDIHLNSSKYSIYINLPKNTKKMKKSTILFFIILVYFASAQACSRCRGTCTSQGCSQCEDGFMLSTQGWCGIFTPVEGCRTYDALANACASCNPDRQLI